MRAGLKWAEFLLNHWKKMTDRGPVRLPGKVDRYARLPVAGAHPKVVSRDGANLRNQQVRRDLVAKPLYRQDCVHGVPARHKVFRLEFLAGARSKTHFEVGQPLIPGAGHSHLPGTILGGKLRDRMKVSCGELGAEKLGVRGEWRSVS